MGIHYDAPRLYGMVLGVTKRRKYFIDPLIGSNVNCTILTVICEAQEAT